ncbi:MAG: ribonuclease J [Mycoplasmataceae bacterium]|jgi:ribonuclease J|nr:ribonuclease J [Mycoplasmataceae bacterium]
MNRIKIIPLGGMDEKGNSCISLEVNEKIYILNAGITFPTSNVLGIQGTIPDYSYFEEKKDKIAGIFIGSPYQENYGSLLQLLKTIHSNCPVYTTSLNAVIIKTGLSVTDDKTINFSIIKPMEEIKLGNLKITPFKVTNSLPKSVGFVFEIDEEKNVIYIDNNIINITKNKFLTNDLLNIVPLIGGKQNILLITPSGVFNNCFTSPNFTANQYFKDLLIENSNLRISFAFFTSDIYRIVALLNASLSVDPRKPIYISNPGVIELLKAMSQEGYLNYDKFKFITAQEITASDKPLLIIVDEKECIYDTLIEITDDEIDEISYDEKDMFVFGSSTINGLEKKEADLFDNVNRLDVAKAIKIDKKILDVVPSSEDLKFMIAFTMPKYIIPTYGLYMNFSKLEDVGIRVSKIYSENTIIPQNGQVLVFDDFALQVEQEIIPLTPQFVSSHGNLDSNKNSILERKQMQSDGAVLISFLIDKTKKRIIKNNYDVVGVTDNSEKSVKSLNVIKEETLSEFNKYVEAKIDSNELDEKDTKDFKIFIRKLISKKFRKEFDKDPLVVTTVIFIKNK